MLNALLSFLTIRSARAIPLALAVALAGMVTAQNLVPNPSFEDTANCAVPTQCTLLKARHWSNPTLSTPDVFDQDEQRLCGYAIPSASGEYMPPEDGLRMAGEFFWDGPSGGDTRDYMLVSLATELVQGVHYQVSLWYVRNRAFQAAVDHIGVWFGQDSTFEATTGPMDLVPQVKLRDPNGEYLATGIAWTRLVDTLTATGGEAWMIIGNFDPQDSIHAIVADAGAPYTNCYYYIDNVAVEPLTGSGIPELMEASAFWDGGNLVIRANDLSGAVRMDVLDALGRTLQGSTLDFVGGRAELPVGGLAYSDGVYLIHLRSAEYETVVRLVKGEGKQ